jgi:papain like protease
MPKRRTARQPASLEAAIRQRGFNWEAGSTSLSDASIADLKAHLGLTVTEEELRAGARAVEAATALRAVQAAPTAPAAIDWRNNGGDWTTPIKDQQSCGSCVSFGTCGTIEARIKIACKTPGTNPDLAEAHLFYCGCGNCCGTGWNFPPALDFCKNTGVASESAFPYTPGNQPCKQGLTPYIKITSWTSVLAIPDRKAVLASKGPMVAGMAVYQDFRSYRSGVYRHVSGGLAGYHAISVVGYDDAQQCWICKNSWGTGWGESGWFKIGYGECLIDTSFAFYDVDLTCPTTPDTSCRRYIPFLLRVLRAARMNPGLRACLAYYICRFGQRPLCTAEQIRIVRLVLMILRHCPQYLKPFCRALRLG